jgi:hypothetical protein
VFDSRAAHLGKPAEQPSASCGKSCASPGRPLAAYRAGLSDEGQQLGPVAGDESLHLVWPGGRTACASGREAGVSPACARPAQLASAPLQAVATCHVA